MRSRRRSGRLERTPGRGSRKRTGIFDARLVALPLPKMVPPADSLLARVQARVAAQATAET